MESEGSFDELEEIVLLRQETHREHEWEVELVVDGREHPIELMETRDEEEARAEAERLASRLDLPLTERAEY